MSDTVQNVFLVLGGLGLFLYGMKLLVDGLEEMAGNRMRKVVERATSNRFFGIGIGAIVTVVIQSSTATSLIAVGLINAGLMSLARAISLVMGAHIGTTLTAHIFAFGIGDVAPLFIFAGLMLYLFVKRAKSLGYVLLSIGILFFGLTVMGGPLREFAQTPGFQALFLAFENPILAILSGFIFTAIIQSSTAATGILISLYLGGFDLNFTTAAYQLLGISIGTTVTALMASMAGRRESKRLAIANTIYITMGSAIFGLMIFIFPGILLWFQNTWQDGARQIAMLFTFFKASLTVAFLPFVGHLARLMYKIMPKRVHSTDDKELHHIKENAISSAEIIEQSYQELHRMAIMVSENFQLSLDALYQGNRKKADEVFETETNINYLGRQITSLLGGIQNVESEAELKRISTLMYIAGDLERIGDHATNIAEYDLRNNKKELRLNLEALREMQTLSSRVIDIITMSVNLFDNVTNEALQDIYTLERTINHLTQKYTESHINRLKTQKIDPRGGVVFVNMLTNLERCGDHANNISFYFMESNQSETETAPA